MKTKTSILVRFKAFFILLVMCCFSSCETAVNINEYEISVVEYDSCEYLISGSGYSQMMTHKGNCKYCAKRSLK